MDAGPSQPRGQRAGSGNSSKSEAGRQRSNFLLPRFASRADGPDGGATAGTAIGEIPQRGAGRCALLPSGRRPASPSRRYSASHARLDDPSVAVFCGVPRARAAGRRRRLERAACPRNPGGRLREPLVSPVSGLLQNRQIFNLLTPFLQARSQWRRSSWRQGRERGRVVPRRGPDVRGLPHRSVRPVPRDSDTHGPTGCFVMHYAIPGDVPQGVCRPCTEASQCRGAGEERLRSVAPHLSTPGIEHRRGIHAVVLSAARRAWTFG